MKKLHQVLSAHITWLNNENKIQPIKTRIYYYLYIDCTERSCTYKVESIPEEATKSVKEIAEGHTMYREVVAPWLQGLSIDEIKPIDITKKANVSINKFNDTVIDRIYNWYCRQKGRIFLELSPEDLDKIYNT